jgi:hypothetical protein
MCPIVQTFFRISTISGKVCIMAPIACWWNPLAANRAALCFTSANGSASPAVNAEAEKVVGRTRESTQEDLYNAIERGDFPR